MRLVPAWHSPARHRSPAKPAPRSGFFPGKKFQSSCGGRTAARFFLPMAARPQLPGIEARPRLPGIGALPSLRQGIPRKKIQGLPPSILLSPQDCLLQSCCHPRIENSTRNSTRGNSEKKGHACFQFRTPRGTPRGATRKKRDMPVSSSELHAGSHQKMVGACFQSEALQKHKCHLCFRAHSCPASEASIPSAPHSCRACPASEPPACQARAKVGILPRKKFFETVV